MQRGDTSFDFSSRLNNVGWGLITGSFGGNHHTTVPSLGASSLTMPVMVMMTMTTGMDCNCCWDFLVKYIFLIEGVLRRVLFLIFNGSLMTLCYCTGLLLTLSPR